MNRKSEMTGERSIDERGSDGRRERERGERRKDREERGSDYRKNARHDKREGK